jgi:hypothetical protein
MPEQTIAEFVLARLAEDEAIAARATLGPWEACLASHGHCEGDGEVWAHRIGRHVVEGPMGGGEQKFHDAWHAARHDPTRVLGEVAAKRRVLARHSAAPGGEELAMPPYCAAHAYRHRDGTVTYPVQLDACPDLRDLAAPYAWHPEYRAGWAPDVP